MRLSSCSPETGCLTHVLEHPRPLSRLYQGVREQDDALDEVVAVHSVSDCVYE